MTIYLPEIQGDLSNHKVYQKVRDACYNNSTCDYGFLFYDNIPPISNLINEDSIIFSSVFNGVTITASDFKINSSDNCTASEDLRFTFDEDGIYNTYTLNCGDVIMSPSYFTIYVHDDKGNFTKDSVLFSILDPSGICIEEKSTIVIGKVVDKNGLPIIGAIIQLDAMLPEFPQMKTTDGEGDFIFFVYGNFNYELSVMMNDSLSTHISIFDILSLNNYLKDTLPFDSPYQYLAADLNFDSSVDDKDLEYLRKKYFGICTTENVLQWYFSESSVEFENNQMPKLSELKNNFEFTTTSGTGPKELNFIGFQLGKIH